LALNTLWNIYRADPLHHRVYMAAIGVVYYITIEGDGVASHAERMAFAAAFVAATEDARWRAIHGLSVLVLGNPTIAEEGVTASDGDIQYVVSTSLANVGILEALTRALS
jgi:hypothetical protein